MEREQLYNKTCDILFNAYFNDTLQHGSCAACAVGNIIAANVGYNIVTKMGFLPAWDACDETHEIRWYEYLHKLHLDRAFDNQVEREIAATGYTPCELLQIEEAFETAGYGDNAEDFMFNGLVNVLNVLADIHGITDDTQTARFTEHYNHRNQIARNMA